MAGGTTPHFANDAGAERIFIGVKEFKCMGARPPFDHPHVYLDDFSDSASAASPRKVGALVWMTTAS